MNIQDLIDDCNKQIEWVNNKDEYNVNALQFASYFKERLIEINDRTCESCKNLKITDTCFCNVYNYWLTFESMKVLKCNKWESKDD
jgi:hypothetical protein